MTTHPTETHSTEMPTQANLALAHALAQARLDNKQLTTLSPEWDLHSEAQAIQTMFAVDKRLNWPRLGWKIAATNPALQKQLRTEHPVFGITYQRDLMTSPATVPFETLLDPIIECEFAFKLAQDLPSRSTKYSPQEVVQAIEAVYPCIEIAQCRFHHKHLPSPWHIMADGFAAGQYVLGHPIQNWQDVLENGVTVSLYRDQKLAAQGHSNDVMGHPLNPVVWLANHLSKLGKQLSAGDLISSGSCNILSRGRPNDDLEVRYEGLETLILRLPDSSS